MPDVSPPTIPIDAPADIYGGDETKYHSAGEYYDNVPDEVEPLDGQNLVDEIRAVRRPR
jgi:hypothetical protein